MMPNLTNLRSKCVDGYMMDMDMYGYMCVCVCAGRRK